MKERSLADETRLRSIMDALKEEPKDVAKWTEQTFRRDMARYQGLGERTINTTMRDLKRMETHPKKPVKTHGTRLELLVSFIEFYEHRRYREGKEATALKNDFKAIRYLAGYRGIPLDLFPKRPPIIEKPRKILPSPEDIHKLLHAKYAPNWRNSYEHHLVIALLVFCFGFGIRAPSEMHAMKKDFLDWKRHIVVIQEPKKNGRQRMQLVKPRWLCCSPTRPTLGNYVRYWRPKVDRGLSDTMFLKPDGTAFSSKEAITQWLKERVNPQFPWFYPYLGRHWCANARLIDSMMNYSKVADWLGHTSVTTLRRHYEHNAENHQELYGVNWLERAFQARGKWARTTPPGKNGSSSAKSP